MNSQLREPPDVSPARDQARGCVWMIAWAAAVTFLCGGLLIGGVLLSEHPSGYAGFFGFIAVGLGVLGAAIAASVAAIDRTVHRTRPSWRIVAGWAAVTCGLALLAPGTAVILNWARLPFDTARPAIAGATIVILALVLVSGTAERRAALVFAAGWVALWGGIGYRSWTDMDAAVVWLGRTFDGPVQVAFEATRSADYEIRIGARSCGDGRVVASGRYQFTSDRDRGDRSELGTPAWVSLPADVLPLRQGDLVRVCLRDGLATATAAGEHVGGPAGESSFWPRD